LQQYVCFPGYFKIKKEDYMQLQKKIGFIGGGKMAEALIKGIIQSKLIDFSLIFAVDPVKERQRILKDKYRISVSSDTNLVADCEIIILAVKPQIMDTVLANLNDIIDNSHLLISIAAGIPLAFIEGRLPKGSRVIRVMPNTPALILEGVSALSPGVKVTPDDLDVGVSIFSAVGKCVTLDEKYLDAVTGLSGSGPAYVFAFLEALVDGGVKVGLNRDDAALLAMQTILGSVKLAMETGEHPAALRAMVTSPGGTTIAGLHELERDGFKAAVMNCVEAATRRSEELGNQLKG
jgi:pyrroline-5-carboxylate reductase